MATNKEYSSKVDGWLGALILLLFVGGLAGLAAGVYILINGGPAAGAWSAIGSGVFTVVLILGLVYPVKYTLTADQLQVRSGLLLSRYEYSVIKSAAPSRNFLSSPALSLDRIKIEYEGKVGFFMISPGDKEAFMKDLAERAAHLSYENGEVRSAS